jgi:hypothetical protein
MQEKQPLWSKKCPKCGHSALEHKHGRPGDEVYRVTLNTQRYCHHPVQAGKDKDIVTFCLCEIKEEDYVRSGNYAMIRLAVKEPVKRK